MNEGYLDETPLSPLGMEIVDQTENGNPSRLRVDEFSGEVEIYMTDRYSVFSVHLAPQQARDLARTLLNLADKIEGE